MKMIRKNTLLAVSILCAVNGWGMADNSLNIGENSVVTGDNSVVGGKDSSVNGNNSIAFGEGAKVTESSVFAIGKRAEVLKKDSLAIGNNTKATEIMTTAVGYGSQANNEYATAVGYQNTATGNQSSVFGSDSKASGHSSLAVGSNVESKGDYSVGMGFKAKTDSVGAVAIGNQATSSGAHGLALGTIADATQKDSVALGHSAQATEINSVALGSSSTTDRAVSTAVMTIDGRTYNLAGSTADSTVSVGTVRQNAQGDIFEIKRTITNVAAGRVSDTSTDAINGSQLHAVTQAVETNAGNIRLLDNRISNISNMAVTQANNYTDSQVGKVGARSAALAGLHPLEFNKDDKASYAVSMGNYKGKSAVALGAFYRPNERTMVGFGTTVGDDTQYTLNVSFKTGKGSDYVAEGKSKDARITRLELLVQQLLQEVQELKASR